MMRRRFCRVGSSLTAACAVVLLLLLVAASEAAFVSSHGSSSSSSLSFGVRRRLVPPPLYAAAKKKKKKRSSKYPPSTVVDEDGPTPETPYVEPEVVKIEDIPEANYDPNAHPIPHQPWRRGVTDGCEDPIEAPWRREAEDCIKNAVNLVGGQVLDVTWYLGRVVITINDDFSNVLPYTEGPEIQIEIPDDGPQYYDPNDPKPEVIWEDEEEPYLYERNVEEELLNKKKMYGPKDPDDDDEDDEDEVSMLDEEVPLFMDKETREDMAAMTEEEEIRLDNQPRHMIKEAFTVDTAAVSTIAGAILQALELEDDRLDVLERHEVTLFSPNLDPFVLETQKEFDVHRGLDVAVETQDPWNSNRTLKGKLLDRNSMDVMINKQGRMVTIPHNFVKCVRLTTTKRRDLEDVDKKELEDLEEE